MTVSHKAARVVVLDTSALVMGIDPSALDSPAYSTESVADELVPDSLIFTRLTTARSSGHLVVKIPSRRSKTKVAEMSSGMGDINVLSNTDLEVLALALDLKEDGYNPTIISDDYAVQNVAEALNVTHVSLSTLGITRKFRWTYYCPACFRKYRVKDVERTCRVCGTRLRRRVSGRQSIRRRLGADPIT